MEKLIELLNEYVEKYNKSDLDYTFELDKDNGLLFCYDDTTDHKGWTMQDEAMVICSKQFGFIKRLVKNDKIDLEKVEKKFYNEICITDYGDKDRAYGKSDLVISVLSISENPIEDLISYLK